MIGADIGRALLLATIPVAWLRGTLSMEQLYIVAFLVATGTVPDAHGGVPPEFMIRSADVIASSIPRAERQVIEGAGHMVDAKLVAPVLERFFRG